MSDVWRQLLAHAVAAEGCAAVARRLGVSRPAISLLNAGKYPGREEFMAQRVVEHFGRISCPHLGREVLRSECAETCAGDAPTSSPAALRHWRAGQKCQHKLAQGDNHVEY